MEIQLLSGILTIPWRNYCKKQYIAKLKKKEHGEGVTELVSKKRGRPLTLGELDAKVQQHDKALQKAGTPVNARIVVAAAKGIVKATDRTLSKF